MMMFSINQSICWFQGTIHGGYIQEEVPGSGTVAGPPVQIIAANDDKGEYVFY